MSNGGSEGALLRDPRLAPLATREWPAWLWSADGSRILWANATGAAIFGAETSRACAERRFHVSDLAAAQVIRLAATLPAGEQERLVRLRGFAHLNRPLVCACSRMPADHGGGAVLIAATEAAGPALPLAERVRRLLEANERPIAAFLPDGRFLYANTEGERWFGGTGSLGALGLDRIATLALHDGTAKETARLHGHNVDIVATSLGQGASRVLLLTIDMIGVSGPPLETVELAGNGSAPSTLRPAAAPVAAGLSPQALQPGPTAEPASMLQRRHPLRFVWEMDADGRFGITSDEFIQLIGARAALLGRPWREIAAVLAVDPTDQVGRAVASRETWSGITVSWPVSWRVGSEQENKRLPVELSGLPVFDRDRNFRGYRGFGVCRELAEIDGLTRGRPEEERSFAASLGDTPLETPASAAGADVSSEQKTTDAAARPVSPAPDIDPSSANVVPFRPTVPTPTEPKTAPGLSAVERRAFHELAHELTSRLRGGQTTAPTETVSEEAAARAQIRPDAPDQDPREDLPLALEPGEEASQQARQALAQRASSDEALTEPTAASFGVIAEHALLDRIPIGVLVYRHDEALYANRHFLDLSGYGDLAAMNAAGGLSALIAEPGAGDTLAAAGGAQALAIISRQGEKLPVEGRMFKIPWRGSSAMALILTKAASKAGVDPETAIRNGSAEEGRSPNSQGQPPLAASAVEFVAKISHEIRTPLTAITGFAEAMMTERFGPIGNEHYREYIKDIHAAGSHLSLMLNDLFDLSRVEAGGIDLTFANVNLNNLTQQCVAIMQPQANRACVIIRTALTMGLPPIMADGRALRQIVLGLLSNSIRCTGPGGQIIVSTVFSDAHEAVLRIRDTGAGMSQKDLEVVLEPFQETATSASLGSGGTGFSLPLTKALAEANHAHFSIKSAPDAGTLVEIAFPSNRLVAA